MVADNYNILVFGYSQDFAVTPYSIVNYRVPTSDTEQETIEFAAFLSDYDPSLLFIQTYCHAKNVSYLKLLKIEYLHDDQRKDDIEEMTEDANVIRSYSMYEDEDKKELIENLKNNLLGQEAVFAQQQTGYDNFQVTFEAEK